MVRKVQPVVYGNIENKVHEVVARRRNHHRRLEQLKQPNEPRISNWKPSIFPRPAQDENVDRIDVCNKNKNNQNFPK